MAQKLTGAKLRYWQKRMPGASAHQVQVARNRQIRQHDPNAIVPGSGLTPLALDRQVGADAELQFGPQRQQLQTQLGQVDPVYDAYRSSVLAAQQASQAAYQAELQRQQSASQASQGQDLAQRQQLFQSLTNSPVPVTVDPNLIKQSQDAAVARQQQADAQQALLGTTGANQQGYLAGRAALGEGGRVARKQDIQGKQTALAGQEGAFKVSDRAKVVTDTANRTATLQNAATAQAVAGSNAQLNQEKAKEAQRHNVAGERTARSNVRVKKRGQDINKSIAQGRLDLQRQNAATRNQLSGDRTSLSRAQFQAKYGITPEQSLAGAKPTRGTPTTDNKVTAGSRTAITKVQNAVGVIRQLTQAEGKKANTHKIRTVLALPKSKDNPYGGFDHDVINAAYDIVTFGHLSPANRKALTALGVQIPAGW